MTDLDTETSKISQDIPSSEERLTLDDLIAGVTPGLVGGEVDWGPDVGNEIIG